MDEPEYSLWKYMDMPKHFYVKANEIEIACKQSQRKCEQIAKQLAGRRPKTAEEFERVEDFKQFVITTSTVNDKVLDLLQYIHKLLQGVANDANALMDGGKLHDLIHDQSDTIKILMQQRDKNDNEYINKLRPNKANTQQSA